ncbi:NAD(+) synthase [Sandaracinomonas limnophila]|uniref:Glutamine-dependent NAD(+) synthetase n=1 Tax=Sandaracinomonas limnophila TaxID=1862386 RepID=A0A437PXI1_9BACT|nr:NAD(+) synthase [Sandaracinomonas limnophila]RVU26949.1 NAD(+) synthase [Sandaracinomonas limnophila]
MSFVSIAAVTLNQIPLDWDGNLLRIQKALKEIESHDIVNFPELCLSGYGCEDQFLGTFVSEKSIESLLKLKEQVQNQLVLVGLPIWWKGKLFNATAILFQKEILALIPKQFLANDGVHYEARWFTPWPSGIRDFVDLGGTSVPFGDYVVDFSGIRLGIEICQDAWEEENRPAYQLAKRGVQIVCNGSASHFSFGKNSIRREISRKGSEIVQGIYVFSNLLGNESGRTIFDGDAYLCQNGRVLKEMRRFSFQEFAIISQQFQISSSYNLECDGVLSIDFNLNKFSPVETNTDTEELQKQEEFAKVIALGLWDYMRKSYSNGWVLSLSGGADSSAIASLCYLAIKLAERDLGLDGLKKSLGYFTGIQTCQNTNEVLQKALTTVYQGTKNSSANTRNSAKQLAANVGSTHFEIEIDEIVAQYRMLIESAIGRELTWQQDDITLQNVQARVRAPSAWMLANIQNGLLLATSNRSEASVGYATMDGDTSGSISPIAGIDKSFIREWLKWMEKEGLGLDLKLPSLKFVNALEPSAELRPLDTKQVDEEDLMPYPILNFIEKSAFRNKNSPEIVFDELKVAYSDKFSVTKLWEFADRYFKLWSRNQWKRERYAPGFHVDDYSLDPKSWLRFPILSAGLAKDLPQKP